MGFKLKFTKALLVLALALTAGGSGAHTRSESYSHWHLTDSGVTASVTIPLREVMLLYQVQDATTPPRELFLEHLRENLAAGNDSADCPMTSSNQLQAPSGFVRVELYFDCGEGPPGWIRFRAMFKAAPSHVHYAKLYRQGTLLGESLFTDTTDTWELGAMRAGANYSFTAFLGIGVEHIAGGIDHIAFLIGLLLIAGSLGRSVVAVTGFTLGHSISLAAAVLGYVHADGQLVEAFIGFTVALVAAEYFLLRRVDVARYAILCMAVAWVTGSVAVYAGFLPARALYAYAGFGIFAACYLLAAADAEKNGGGRATLLRAASASCMASALPVS